MTLRIRYGYQVDPADDWRRQWVRPEPEPVTLASTIEQTESGLFTVRLDARPRA